MIGRSTHTSTSCVFTRIIPFLDGILTTYCALLWSHCYWWWIAFPKCNLSPLKWKPTNPPFFFNSLIEEASLMLAMWWDGEPQPQSAPQWLAWIRPTGAPSFRHSLGLWSYGKPLRTLIPQFGFGAIFGVMPHFIVMETCSFGLPTSIPFVLGPF